MCDDVTSMLATAAVTRLLDLELDQRGVGVVQLHCVDAWHRRGRELDDRGRPWCGLGLDLWRHAMDVQLARLIRRHRQTNW